MRKLSLSLVALALLAGACAKTSTTSKPAAGGARTFNVQLDGKTDGFNGVFPAFFPKTFSAHPGDTIKFSLPHFNGEPHTVGLGTLVDKGVTKVEQLGPKGTFAQQESSPELLNLPDIFPHEVPKDGPPGANQSAGQPCFLDTGVPPLSLLGRAGPCPKRAQPEFNGTQSFYNSGVIQEDGASFTVKLKKDIKPGSYGLMCMIHRGGMTGRITVAAADQTVPSPDTVTKAGKDALDKLIAALKPAADSRAKVQAGHVAVGIGDPNVPEAIVAEFAPKTVTAKVGETVTFDQFFFHSISFNASDSDVGAFIKEPDGTVKLNEKAGAPAGVDVPESLFTFPPPDDGKPVTVDMGKWDGTGFKSTGVTGSVPPVLETAKIVFTKPGTYALRCLLHPDMKAEVRVA
jgi:plastocyanin